ncbi:unnamed protein product [Triticum turgidum subsp. durum]|uniref:CASP-like protein n=1 Tax=Triticum turgidum subsp. durum TaxID=4567 RepID=A0A9R0VK13_TRITD|nr:unnamed protein product [Triticum turgidum subsp. durum]
MPPTPQKDAVMAESPTGSPQKESALTVAKLLSAEDPAATEAKPAADKVAPAVVTESVAGGGGGGGGGGGKVGVGSKRWLLRGVPDRVRLTELKRAELGFRVSAAVFCLISVSVMSSGTTPGWAGDSFRRYNEYSRYWLTCCCQHLQQRFLAMMCGCQDLAWINLPNLSMPQAQWRS